jgi:hypothetical protein
MANVVYITCRTLARTQCTNRYFHIAEVGWVRDNGQSGTADLQSMVNWLTEDQNNEAYSQAPNGQRARVRVLNCGNHKYIETYPDWS